MTTTQGAFSKNGIVGGGRFLSDPPPCLPPGFAHALSILNSLRTAGLIRSYQTPSPLSHLRNSAQQQ